MVTWPNGAWVLRKTIRALSQDAFIAMECAKKHGLAPDEQRLQEADFPISVELFDIVGNVCQGDALAILRGVEDCRGVYAWSKFNQDVYNPRTVVGRIRLLEQIARSGIVIVARDVELVLAAWRDGFLRLVAVFGDRLSDAGQVACVTAMLPVWAQEYAHRNAQNSWDLEMRIERVVLESLSDAPAESNAG